MNRLSGLLKKQGGFGIVEAIVAIAAAGIVITLILGLFNTTTKTYDITIDKVARLQEARGALNTIKKDLQSCLLMSEFNGKDNNKTVKEGYPADRDTVSFSLTQLEKQNDRQVLALGKVSYELVSYGGPDFPLFELKRTVEIEAGKQVRLIPGSAYAGLKFSYKKPSRGINAWVDSWDHKYIPDEVKVCLWVDDGSGREQLYQLETAVTLGGGL